MFAIVRVTPGLAVPATQVPEVLPITVPAGQPTLAQGDPATPVLAAVPTTARAALTTPAPVVGNIRGQVGANITVLVDRSIVAPAGQLMQVPVVHVMPVLVGPAIQGPEGPQIAPASATETPAQQLSCNKDIRAGDPLVARSLRK
jgi:hypothetical protein